MNFKEKMSTFTITIWVQKMDASQTIYICSNFLKKKKEHLPFMNVEQQLSLKLIKLDL